MLVALFGTYSLSCVGDTFCRTLLRVCVVVDRKATGLQNVLLSFQSAGIVTKTEVFSLLIVLWCWWFVSLHCA